MKKIFAVIFVQIKSDSHTNSGMGKLFYLVLLLTLSFAFTLVRANPNQRPLIPTDDESDDLNDIDDGKYQSDEENISQDPFAAIDPDDESDDNTVAVDAFEYKSPY